MAIYVKESDVPKTRTRKSFIKKFLMGKKISSYENPEFTIIQCDGKGENVDGASRSITELWELTKSRFPATSMKAMVKILFEIIQEDQSVVLVWCDKIQKVVVKYVLNTSAQWITNYSVKNHYNKKGVDGYSLADYDEIKNNM
jgi:hypothetical protein